MKKYLKTPEEVVDALKSGKNVYTTGDIEHKLYKGIIIGKVCGDTIWSVGTDIVYSQKPYIEEPEPLKIEVGKFYKTRGGEKARCYCQSKQNSFFTIDGEPDGYYVWTDTGRLGRGDATSSCDIIGPWEE